MSSPLLLIEENEYGLFPIKTKQQFVDFVINHLEINQKSEPNLAFLSIVFGYLECQLTAGSGESTNIFEDRKSASDDSCGNYFPTLHREIVEELYTRFCMIIRSRIDITQFKSKHGHAKRSLCKYLGDLILSGLIPNYQKDKCHISSIFNFMAEYQLDNFGFTVTTLAACQLLSFKDVHLVVSGDHSWLTHGSETKPKMTEVTWHSNKHNQYLRGDKISSSLYSKNWLYHNGRAVRCDRWMEVAALVLSINPSIDGETQSRELASVQLQLLDYLYKKQYLNKYPIAICSYCELLECFPDHNNKHYDVITLYDEAVRISHNEYSDHHVLVHCSKAYHCIRQRRYSDALKCFAGAATSLAKYNHMKGDDEIYKEIIEIANETIPQLFRDCPILFSSKDCFHDLVRFYDGVCSWEEGSQTPVIGTPMARNFVTIVNSFHIEIRENFAEEEDETRKDNNFEDDFQPTPPHSPYDSGGHCHGKLKLTVCSGKMFDLKRSLTHREKINQSAACLLLTALSHTTVPKRERRKGEYDVTYNTNNRKRKRER